MLAPGHQGGVATGATVAVVRKAARDQLVPFASKDELTKFLKDLAEAQRKEVEAQAKAAADSDGVTASGAAPAEAAPASPAPAASAAASTSDTSITNTQHAGVDEGDIVKMHGDHLVVLRRGRLFTINVGSDGKALEPISSVDAYGPGINPGGTWYDEMLVSKDTVVVIGYSYERGGTEVGLFDIDAVGHLRYRSTYQVRSNDYYSSRNYASRLIGSKLIFYSPLYLHLGGADPFQGFPAVRHWHPGATDAEFVSIFEPTRIYRPIEPAPSLALHTVTICDLAAPSGMQCSARAVMGPEGRVFYVSPDSVYVWMSPWEAPDAQQKELRSRSLVYRLPLDGGEPSVVRVRGTPTDQFSFEQTGDGYLNVLVRAEAAGDAMWAPEVTSGDIALLRMPLGLFSRAADEAPASEYTKLPKPDGYTLENRFVGDYVLYGTGETWGYGQPKLDSRLYAYRWAGGQAPVQVRLGHGVDRIEAMGRDAVVVGGDGKDLHFSTIALGGPRPALAGRYVRQGAAQGETRSHGFFYKPDGDRTGLVGLPIRSEGSPGYAQLAEGSASVLFLRNDDLQLREIGALGAHPGVGRNDACRASCVDWYGNARPIFLRGRIFALLGYELVEGEMDGARLFETRRVSFAPGAQRPVRAQ